MLRVAHSRMGVLLRFATTQEKVATILGREGALRARIEDDVGCEIGGSNWNCLTIWLWGDECQGWRDVQGCSSREGRGTVGARVVGGLWPRGVTSSISMMMMCGGGPQFGVMEQGRGTGDQ